jgi:hypothetical protein
MSLRQIIRHIHINLKGIKNSKTGGFFFLHAHNMNTMLVSYSVRTSPCHPTADTVGREAASKSVPEV